MDRHKDYVLAKVCQVGGQKTAKSSKSAGYSVRAFAIELLRIIPWSIFSGPTNLST